MARSREPDSASSQFFIMHADSTHLDGEYAAFGKLIEGEDILDKVAGTEVRKNPDTGEKSSPVKEIRMKKVTVITEK